MANRTLAKTVELTSPPPGQEVLEHECECQHRYPTRAGLALPLVSSERTGRGAVAWPHGATGRQRPALPTVDTPLRRRGAAFSALVGNHRRPWTSACAHLP